MPNYLDITDRIISRIRIYDGCWKDDRNIFPSTGYIQFKLSGRNRTLHSVAYETFIGPLVDGLQIDHLCRNRDCFNPDHLEQVTPAINQYRGNGFSGINYRKKKCKKGHQFTESNTYVDPNRPNRRDCKTCRREAVRRYHLATPVA